MYIEVGTNLFHTAILFILIWGITRFFGVLGKVAEGQSSKRVQARNEAIKFTK